MIYQGLIEYNQRNHVWDGNQAYIDPKSMIGLKILKQSFTNFHGDESNANLS